MKYLTHYISLILLVLTISCNPGPEPIHFGHDACSFCKMTIVDPRYAAELVTSKGKVFKFDAVECMINYKNEQTKTSFSMTLVSTFDSKTLISVTDGAYLRTQKLPSPMGMYITAFSDKKAAHDQATQYGGEIYSWESLNQEFGQLPVIKPFDTNP